MSNRRHDHHLNGIDRKGHRWCICCRKVVDDLDEARRIAKGRLDEARRIAKGRLDEPGSRYRRIEIYELVESVVEVVR